MKPQFAPAYGEGTPARPPSTPNPFAERLAIAFSARCWRLGFSWLRLYRMPASAAQAAEEPGLAVRLASEAELAEASRDPRYNLPREWMLEVLARGDRCLAAWCEGRMAGFAWLSRSLAPHDDGVFVKVPEGAEYRYKVLVLPEFRGRGIARALYRHANAALAAAGGSQAYLFIAPHNVASRRAAHAAGAVPVGSMWLPAAAWLPPLHSKAVRGTGFAFVRMRAPR